VPHGAVDGRTGHAAYEALLRAIDGTLAGEFDGIVTAPLSKAALHAAGHFYPGHTELLAERCGVTDFAMMLYLPPHELPNSPAGLGVAHVTLHMALRDVFANLSDAAILEKCHLAHRVMSNGFGLAAPRIGVCALNPHGGEGGLFGDEESRFIAPAVEQARAAGIDASGPFPTDTLMVRARDGEFDGIVAMYHDQGHIALKLLGMHRAVNITLGLPIIRTSVAHGTAFDRAWQGTAESTGMVAAITTAAKLARR
jgi:4-hydroxythreonine-4-phosphate dehydrogenase